MEHEEIIRQLTLEEKAGLCSGKDYWHLKGIPRLGLESHMVSDGPHGLRKQEEETDMFGFHESIKAVCFPANCALAASFDRKLAKEVGQKIADECQAVNVRMILGPGVNIKRTPLCGRNFEYFSEDPVLTSKMAAAQIKGIQSEGIGVCMKHFCVNNQEYHRMSVNAVVDERTLHEIYLAAFEEAVKEADPASIMCSYNKLNGAYLAENHYALTDILRTRWNYRGMVMTDWGAVKDRVTGLKAGLDVEMPGMLGYATDIEIVEAVKAGELPEDVLDRTVDRILDFILWAQENKKRGISFDYERDHAFSAEVAAECAVLLKNEDHILPLEEGKRIAFIGEYACKPRFQGGGSSKINCWREDGILQAIQGMNNIKYAKGYVDSSFDTDSTLLKEAVKLAEESDIAVIFTGLPTSIESEGYDRKNLNIPANQAELIEAVANVQKNTVVVLHNGSPVAMPWLGKVKAVLEMYLGGEAVGYAEKDLLFGKVNPSGKLPETFPLRLSDTPAYLNYPGSRNEVEYREGIFVGYRYYDKKQMEVLFPFGYGLSYTDFKIGNLKLDKKQIEDNDTVSLSFTVKNIGNRFGQEVVQVYICPARGEICRPVRELKEFEKVALMPGEEKKLEMKLGMRAFAYYDCALKDWCVESGDYIIEIGNSSRNICDSQTLHIESTAVIPRICTKYSTLGEILTMPKGQELIGGIVQKVAAFYGVNQSDMSENQDSELLLTVFYDSPINTFVSMGLLAPEQLNEMITMLNEPCRY